MDNENLCASVSQSCNSDEQFLYNSLMQQLKEITSKIQEQESMISVQKHDHPSPSQVERLADIIKEKKRIIGELTAILSEDGGKDFSKNYHHVYLKIMKDLTTDLQETVETGEMDRKKLSEVVNTCQEEDARAEQLQTIAKEDVLKEDYLRMVNQAFAEGREDVNYVLKKIFPDEDKDMKNLLHLLCEASDNPDDQYISTQNCNEKLVEFLHDCCLVQSDPNDRQRIKFVRGYTKGT